MDMLIVVSLVVIVVWYFGGTINAVVQGANRMASKEFDLVQDQQEVRIAKAYDDLGRKLENVLSSSTHTRGSVKGMIEAMNETVTAGKE